MENSAAVRFRPRIAVGLAVVLAAAWLVWLQIQSSNSGAEVNLIYDVAACAPPGETVDKVQKCLRSKGYEPYIVQSKYMEVNPKTTLPQLSTRRNYATITINAGRVERTELSSTFLPL